MSDGQKIIVLTTCESQEQADSVARHLIEHRLAACVNILPARSVYRWKEKIESSPEHLLIIKSRHDMLDRLRSSIQSLHTYELPELIVLPIVDGSVAYLNWIDQELSQ